METKSKLDYKKIKEAHYFLWAIDDQNRIEIIEYISKKGSVNVTNLYIHFRCEQATMSQQLSRLRKAGIIEGKREGKNIEYSISDTVFEKIKAIRKFSKIT